MCEDVQWWCTFSTFDWHSIERRHCISNGYFGWYGAGWCTANHLFFPFFSSFWMGAAATLKLVKYYVFVEYSWGSLVCHWVVPIWNNGIYRYIHTQKRICFFWRGGLMLLQLHGNQLMLASTILFHISLSYTLSLAVTFVFVCCSHWLSQFLYVQWFCQL